MGCWMYSIRLVSEKKYLSLIYEPTWTKDYPFLLVVNTRKIPPNEISRDLKNKLRCNKGIIEWDNLMPVTEAVRSNPFKLRVGL